MHHYTWPSAWSISYGNFNASSSHNFSDCGDNDRNPFQLQPDFPTRQLAGSAEEQRFSTPLGSMKEQWIRQARQKAWRANLLHVVDDRYYSNRITIS